MGGVCVSGNRLRGVWGERIAWGSLHDCHYPACLPALLLVVRSVRLARNPTLPHHAFTPYVVFRLTVPAASVADAGLPVVDHAGTVGHGGAAEKPQSDAGARVASPVLEGAAVPLQPAHGGNDDKGVHLFIRDDGSCAEKACASAARTCLLKKKKKSSLICAGCSSAPRRSVDVAASFFVSAALLLSCDGAICACIRTRLRE